MTKAERTRSFIIEKAAPIINRKGLAGTSITDIMEATKLAKGGIYGNFESKEEICAEALDFLLARNAAGITAGIVDKHSAKEQLFGLFDYFTGTLYKEGNYGCPMLNFGAEADDTEPAIKARVSKAISDTETLIGTIVKDGIAKGEFNKNFDPSSFALKAFVIIEGGMWMSRVLSNPNKMRSVVGMLKKEIEENCL